MRLSSVYSPLSFFSHAVLCFHHVQLLLRQLVLESSSPLFLFDPERKEGKRIIHLQYLKNGGEAGVVQRQEGEQEGMAVQGDVKKNLAI